VNHVAVIQQPPVKIDFVAIFRWQSAASLGRGGETDHILVCLPDIQCHFLQVDAITKTRLFGQK
jgi:hypothetical protein